MMGWVDDFIRVCDPLAYYFEKYWVIVAIVIVILAYLVIRMVI
jgi:hypothetical protein